MPSIELTCEKCQHQGNIGRLWGRFYYLHEGVKAHLGRELGWCESCDDFVPIERFDADEVFKESKEYSDELEVLNKLSFFDSLRPSRKRQIKHCKEKLEGLLLNQFIISKRTGSECCLDCGSHRIKRFDGDYSLDYDFAGMIYRGTKKTGFFHAGCGGEFIATPDPIRLIRRFDNKLYDMNGRRIKHSCV